MSSDKLPLARISDTHIRLRSYAIEAVASIEANSVPEEEVVMYMQQFYEAARHYIAAKTTDAEEGFDLGCFFQAVVAAEMSGKREELEEAMGGSYLFDKGVN